MSGLNISEEKELKKQLGNLGRYLIQKAEIEIKELNQKTLFQKAEIKKRILERVAYSFLDFKKYALYPIIAIITYAIVFGIISIPIIGILCTSDITGR